MTWRWKTWLPVTMRLEQCALSCLACSMRRAHRQTGRWLLTLKALVTASLLDPRPTPICVERLDQSFLAMTVVIHKFLQTAPKGRLGMSDVPLLSEISRLPLFDSHFFYPSSA